LGKKHGDWLWAGNELWSLADSIYSLKVPRELRLVHAFSLDRAVCPINKIEDLANCCEKAYEVIFKKEPTHINHWKRLADELRNIKPNKKSLGIGLSCSSVCDPWIDWNGNDMDRLWDIFSMVDAIEILEQKISNISVMDNN